MMIPNSVRNVLNLFNQRELMAIETDLLMLIIAIFRINILHYMIRKRKAKVYWGQVLFFALLIQMQFILKYYIGGDPALFLNGQGSAATLC